MPSKFLRQPNRRVTRIAALLITTELVLCGYPPRDLLLRPSFIKAMADTLDQLVEDIPKDLAVLVGFASANPNARERGAEKSPIQQHCPAAGREGGSRFSTKPCCRPTTYSMKTATFSQRGGRYFSSWSAVKRL